MSKYGQAIGEVGVMEYWQRKDKEAKERLAAMLALPMPKEEHELGVQGLFYPWGLIDGCVSAYNSEIEMLFIDVLVAVRDRTTFDILKRDRALASELVMHILADWLCSYGTSPRGIFPRTEEVKAMLPELIEKWEVYARLRWGDDWREEE